MLTIRGLSKTYSGGVRALDGVDLDVPPGMFGLLGPNGAGKTTLMRTIATLQAADEGSIELDGTDVLREPEAVRRKLGYLPQEFGLDPEVSAEYLLGHIARLKGIRGKGERRDMVRFILEQTNLLEVRKRRLGGFSGGMRQRFGIAQALIGGPSILIVDEPTAGLDPEERNRFHNILSDISEDRIVILSTHIVEDVSVLCSRLAILDGGRVLYAGEAAEGMDAMSGLVWERVVEKEALPALEESSEVILTRMAGGKVLVHVFGRERPAGFDPVVPDLYDLYFDSVRRARKAARAETGEAFDHEGGGA